MKRLLLQSCVVATVSVLCGVLSAARGAEALCGVYAVYAGAELLNVSVHSDVLLKPQFVGSKSGSTFEELELAAQSVGLQTRPLTRLTTFDLRQLQTPTVLHVRTELDVAEYTHFFLLAGERNGRPLLIDGPEPAPDLSWGELASRWDGNALVLSSEVRPARPFATSIYALTMVAMTVTGLLIIERRRLRRTVNEICVLTAVSILVAIDVHALQDGGFLRRDGALARVRRENAYRFVPEVTLAELNSQFRASENPVIISAQAPQDYRRFHIDGAITPTEFDKLADGIERTQSIIVYCAYDKCDSSSLEAKFLLEQGFTDVRIFRGGMAEWRANKQPTTGSRSVSQAATPDRRP